MRGSHSAIMAAMCAVTCAQYLTWSFDKIQNIHLGPRKRDASDCAPAGPCGHPPKPQPLQPIPAELQHLVDLLKQQFTDNVFAASQTATGCVALVYGDQVLTTFGFGKAKDGRDADADTLFPIGSISKIFPVLMSLRLEEEGKLSINDYVTKFLPEYAPLSQYNDATETRLIDLASHMAGLPRMSPCDFGDCNETLEAMLPRINQLLLLAPPADQMLYSNLGFSMLGRLIEPLLGRSFEEEFAYLATKLNMTRSTSVFPMNEGNMANPSYNGTIINLMDLGFDNPAGGVFSSANDMAKLLQFFLGYKGHRNDDDGQLLSSTSLRRWLKMRPLVNPSNVPDNSIYFQGVGAMWEVYRAVRMESTVNLTHYDVITKSGGVPGVVSQFVMQPDTKIGIFVSQAEGGSDPGGEGSTAAIIAGGLQLPTLIAEILAKYVHSPTLVPANYPDFVGTYSTQDNILTFEVIVQDGLWGHGLYLSSNFLAETTMLLKNTTVPDFMVTNPSPSDICFVWQSNIEYVFSFLRNKSGQVYASQVQGQVFYNMTFFKV